MSEKQRIHIAYCDYQITKANKPVRIYSVKNRNNSTKGVKTSGLSKAMFAKQLSMLIQKGEYYVKRFYIMLSVKQNQMQKILNLAQEV